MTEIQILVVDDSSTMRRMVILSLTALGNVSFGEAGSGLEAIENLAFHPADLMTLDLNMPDIHGVEVLKFVRSHQIFHAMPIIVLTTRNDEESRTAVMEAGASHYMTKPFNPADLLTTARDLLNLP